MNKGAPYPLVGKVLSLVDSTYALGTIRSDPHLCSSSIGIVSDCPSGAPAIILRGFFFDNFIFKAPPPGVTRLNC